MEARRQDEIPAPCFYISLVLRNKVFLFVRNIGVDHFIEYFIVQFGAVLVAAAYRAFPVIYG